MITQGGRALQLSARQALRRAAAERPQLRRNIEAPTMPEDDLAAQHLEAPLDDISLRLYRLEQLLTEQRTSAGGG